MFRQLKSHENLHIKIEGLNFSTGFLKGPTFIYTIDEIENIEEDIMKLFSLMKKTSYMEAHIYDNREETKKIYGEWKTIIKYKIINGPENIYKAIFGKEEPEIEEEN